MPSNAIIISEQILEDTADAIRAKKGTSDPIRPVNFPSEIMSIPTGGSVSGTINITTNGTTNVASYEYANVAVPASAVDSGTISITTNGTHDVTGYASADVSVSGGSSSKYGISFDWFVGDVDANGVLQPKQSAPTITMYGFTDVAQGALYNLFSSSSQVGDVTFQTLTNVTANDGLRNTFQSSSITSCSFPQLTTVTGDNALRGLCYHARSLSTLSFPSLISISGNNTFYEIARDSYVTSCSFPLLETISGDSTFSGAFRSSHITSASFPSLRTIYSTSGFIGAFQSTSSLVSVDFSALEVIGNSESNSDQNRQIDGTFNGCSEITTLTFASLREVWCNGNRNNFGTFRNNNYIQKFYFPVLTTISKTSGYSSTLAVDNLFADCSALTEIHFASANQSTIQASTGYATKWGAPNSCTIYFDL